MCKISVVVPVFNAESFIDNCLKSICEQTFNEIEVICIDDGSQDRSLEMLKQWKDIDSRVMVFHQENRGGGSARNIGLDVARGKYIYFMDADDYLEVNAFEDLYMRAEKEKTDIVFFGAYRYAQIKNVKEVMQITNRDLLPYTEVFPAQDVYDNIFELSYGYVWTRFFRREFIINNGLRFQDIRNSWDTSFVYLAMCLAQRMSFLDENLINYRVDNSNSSSMNSEKYPLDVFNVWKFIKEELVRRGIYSFVERSYLRRASEHILNKFWLFNTYDAYKALFFKLYPDGLDELGISSYRNDSGNKELVEQINLIENGDFSGFIFDKCMNYKRQKQHYQRLVLSVAPKQELIPKGCRLVIYGAGKRGRELYSNIIREDYCNIVAWIDKNAENLPSQVESIDYLNHIHGDYDYIVISIEDRDICKGVLNDLMTLGVERDIIIY